MSLDNQKNIRDRIKEIRKQKGITQKELAEKLGITQSGVAAMENSSDSMTMETIRKVASALDVNVLSLFVDLEKIEGNAKMLDEMGFDWDDLELIDDFHRLNPTGKQTARDFVEGLTMLDKYTK